MSPVHSALSSEKIDLMSTLVLTLIGSDDWSKNSGLVHRANFESKGLQSGGQWFTCNERYGGNTLNLLYPYLHLSANGERFSAVDSVREVVAFRKGLPSGAKATLGQGEYIEIDRTSATGYNLLTKARYLIFIGARSNGSFTSEAFESTWRSWSKLGLLTSHLAKQDVPVEGVTFLRQTSLPYSVHFDYAFFVTVDIRSHLEKIKTLNVLQKLRGVKMPGYVSLFEAERGERMRAGATRRRNSSPGADSLEGIIEDLSKHESSSRSAPEQGGLQRRRLESRNPRTKSDRRSRDHESDRRRHRTQEEEGGEERQRRRRRRRSEAVSL